MDKKKDCSKGKKKLRKKNPLRIKIGQSLPYLVFFLGREKMCICLKTAFPGRATLK